MDTQTGTEKTVLHTAGCEAVFDETGALRRLRAPEMELLCTGLRIDVGVNGAYAAGGFRFQPFLDFNTWSLPEIRPLAGGNTVQGPVEKSEADGVLAFTHRCGPLEISRLWREDCGALRLDTRIKNTGAEKLWLNGIAFALALAGGGFRFDFPGNVPYGVYEADALSENEPVETGLVTAVTHFENEDGGLNVIFVDPDEKWGTGVYRSGKDTVWTAIAGAELYLEPGESCQCGSLYLQLLAHGDRFAPIQRFYWEKGWRVPTDGVKDTVVYSGHPLGPWDANFPFRNTMRQYDAYTRQITQMGFDTIWLLPLFDHTEAADPERNVYTPTDQGPIDPRYGTDEDVRAYVEHARALGARVIFDYVPHGPRPQDPMGKQYLDVWASKRQDGSAQEEWTCLSFDMANPTYLAYIKDLVKDHIDRFAIGGTRIDCAMGGLSNWTPYPGNRPSNSNMKGGVAMSSAMREAFVEKGVTPFVTPENFHPIPLYAGCTDAYYDMALYRTLFDLNKAGLPRAQYVFELTRWLENQSRSMPQGMNKLRFLGNHDTVSWVWDAKRATAIYGPERAKAMWVLISLIDGCPMIYQGDEDPAIYLNDTEPVLIDFFTGLFAAKKRYTSQEYDTRYEYTGSALFAFRRVGPGGERLVLINLGEEPEAFRLDGPAQLLYGSAEFNDGRAVLKPNEYCMLQGR